jgi:hypothetical protein
MICRLMVNFLRKRSYYCSFEYKMKVVADFFQQAVVFINAILSSPQYFSFSAEYDSEFHITMQKLATCVDGFYILLDFLWTE